jgi:hypothetical protein
MTSPTRNCRWLRDFDSPRFMLTFRPARAEQAGYIL